jgi:CDP-diacylglycerol--glycerol-3-phosphate 3-phosphatidyltransferase
VAYYITQHTAVLLAKTPITPNIISWSGLVITLGAAALIASGHLIVGGIVVLFAGFFDILDGALARLTHKVTSFGALLDSTLDRVSEGLLLLSVLTFGLLNNQLDVMVILVGFALLGSMLVSYIRARAEALGLECQAGLFTRPERVTVLALGLLLSNIDYALIAALTVIVLFSFITVGQRVIYVRRQINKNDE